MNFMQVKLGWRWGVKIFDTFDSIDEAGMTPLTVLLILIDYYNTKGVRSHELNFWIT